MCLNKAQMGRKLFICIAEYTAIEYRASQMMMAQQMTFILDILLIS